MEALVGANLRNISDFLGLVFLVLYAVLVAVAYLTEGPRFQFKFDKNFPFYSTQRVLVGLGVRLTIWILRLAQRLLSPLYEASAEVGEWVAQRTSPETQARFRSRFI